MIPTPPAFAIAIAIASAFHDKPIAPTVAAFGEISLAGEVRPVASGRQRESESTRLGFTTLISDDSASLRIALGKAFDTAKDSRERELDAAF